jgi:predicted Zn-dependent peptidase
MPNRSKAPKIKTITDITMPEVQKIQLDNGIPVYVVAMGTQEVLKVEVIFKGGRPYEHKKLASRATSALLKEGTQHYTSAELAEKLDYYGSSLAVPYHTDTESLSLLSLSKHFSKVLPLLAEVIKTPRFPQEELQAFVQRSIQHLQVDLSKNDVVAYRQITEMFFGPDHPYGYNSNPDTYNLLKREDLIQHHESLFTANNCFIIISGKVDKEVLEQLNEHLGHGIRSGQVPTPALILQEAAPERLLISKPDSLQSAIRIGFRTFNRHHADYFDLSILNLVLGGYFGSRLMTNIREEKGYTYNIYSTLDAMQFDGCFYIGTEVGHEFLQDTLTQVYLEMDRLRDELVDEDELEMMRNYILGNYLTMIDGPFNVAELVRLIVTEDLPFTELQTSVERTLAVTRNSIQETAKKYLLPEKMSEVIVGKA